MEKITVENVLNRIQARHNLKSDYAVCKLTGLSAQVVSNWRNGRSFPDERMCQILAEAAGLDPLVLAAAMQAQRSKTEEARSMWAMIAERLQTLSPGVAAAVFSAALATSFVADSAYAARAGQPTDLAQVSPNNLYIVYLLSLVLQQLLRTFRDLDSDSEFCLQP